MKKTLLAAIGLLMLPPVAAHANEDAGLYDPLPPEGSAFVRFLNDRPQKGSDPASANGKIFDYLDYQEVSSYFVLPEGGVEASIGDAKKTFDVAGGNFYTVILTEGGRLDVKQDPPNENQAKAQIILYNLSGKENLSLKTADGKVEIVPPLAPGETSEREVNPVKVSLAVYSGEEKIGDLGEVSLDRSQSYSAVVMSEDDIQWVRATTNTLR